MSLVRKPLESERKASRTAQTWRDVIDRRAEEVRASREERRKRMPAVSAFLDDMRLHFGDPVFIRASENGLSVTWGKSALTEEA